MEVADNVLPWTDINDTARMMYKGSWNFSSSPNSGSDQTGVVVGSDATPPTMNDTKLTAQIENGSAAGELIHSSDGVTLPETTPTASFCINQRSFLNDSGGQITVREVGIYSLLGYSSSANASGMIVHDIITPIDIPDGSTLFVDYKIQIDI